MCACSPVEFLHPRLDIRQRTSLSLSYRPSSHQEVPTTFPWRGSVRAGTTVPLLPPPTPALTTFRRLPEAATATVAAAMTVASLLQAKDNLLLPVLPFSVTAAARQDWPPLAPVRRRRRAGRPTRKGPPDPKGRRRRLRFGSRGLAFSVGKRTLLPPAAVVDHPWRRRLKAAALLMQHTAVATAAAAVAVYPGSRRWRSRRRKRSVEGAAHITPGARCSRRLCLNFPRRWRGLRG